MTDETKDTEPTNEGHHKDSSSSHEYDGIKELNNPAPFWVLLLFLATIGFSGIYAIKYFGYPNNGKDQKSEYLSAVASSEQQKQEQSQKSGNAVDVKDEGKMIAAGAKLFSEKGCVACHGSKGEGNPIGPNLTDKFWINGCKEGDLIKIISEGKPEKGMTPFKAMLTTDQIKQISTYILKSLVGSKPANAKAPQGTECK